MELDREDARRRAARKRAAAIRKKKLRRRRLMVLGAGALLLVLLVVGVVSLIVRAVGKGKQAAALEPTAAVAALATAALILGPEQSAPLLQEQGMDAVFVTDQGQVLVTRGLKNEFHLLNKTNTGDAMRVA